jgi:FtsZ-interacting cell division protein ZipA
VSIPRDWARRPRPGSWARPNGKKRKNSASESSSKDEENEDDDNVEEEATRTKKAKPKAGQIVKDNHRPLVAPNLDEMPSDDVLRQWCRAYITVFNTGKATVNHAMAALSEKLGGMDMTSKKPTIRQFLTEEMCTSKPSGRTGAVNLGTV